jgi:putative tryptophan/tyrosine transport system substrate-binding protein
MTRGEEWRAMMQGANTPEPFALRRRGFLALMASAPIAWARQVEAQPKKYLIGSLNTGGAVPDDSPYGAALVKGLSKRGYTVGNNVDLVRRGADLHLDTLPKLVDELAVSGVDVIVCFGYGSAEAVKEKGTLPAVSFTAGDPVGTGLAKSLAQPGGTITGVSDVSAEVTPKRLQYLKDLTPKLRRVAILYNAGDPGMTLRYRAAEAGATAQGVSIQQLGVREPNDFDQAFAVMNAELPDAILMVSDVLTNLNRKRVFEFADAHRLPAIYENNLYVRDGGLISYGPDIDEGLDRVAYLVDRILKGAKPADLPFERPTVFRLALNLKTAKALDLNVSPLLLQQADEVIE